MKYIFITLLVCVSTILHAQRSTDCRHKLDVKPSDGLITRIVDRQRSKRVKARQAARIYPAHCWAYYAKLNTTH